MADAKRVTILNQRDGKIVFPADAEDLKRNPKTPHRVLLAGQAIEVSAEDAAKYLTRAGLVDASKLVAGIESAEVKRLKAELVAAKAENARLNKKGAKDAPADDDSETDDVDNGVLDAKKGVACLLPDGTSTGVIQSVNKAKKTAKVKLDSNGNVSVFDIANLKPVPVVAA